MCLRMNDGEKDRKKRDETAVNDRDKGEDDLMKSSLLKPRLKNVTSGCDQT